MYKTLSLAVCLLLCACAPAQNDTSATKASSLVSWTAEARENSIVYLTHGATNPEHQFGLIKKKGNCAEDTLSITWTTSSRMAQNLKGVTADFEMNVDGVVFNLPIELQEAAKVSPTSARLIFSNFIANEKLIGFFEHGNLIQARIVGPEKLTRQLDNPADLFNLEGFEEVRAKAGKMCKDL